MKQLLLTLVLSTLTLLGISQTRITGEVYDEENLPIIGANILIKGTTVGTVTNIDGKFELDATEDAGTLVVSFLGYETQELDFNDSQNFTVQLKIDRLSLEEVLVIGYGSIKKQDATTAVSSVGNLEKIASRPVTNLQDFFQGSVAGVTVQQQGGDPSRSASITIRGMGTLNTESPLWVVDGMPYYGGALNPNDIESVTILKDAAAAAIYGAQASSGVIVVTTKSGKSGKLSVSIDSYLGMQQATNLPTPLTAEEQNLVYNTAADNSGAARNPARDVSLNPWGGTTRSNWIDEVFRNAAIYNTSVSLSGGTDRGTYSASFFYQKKEGVLLETLSERLGLRVKSDFDISDKITIGQNLYVNSDEAIGANTSSGYSGVIINAIYMPSAASVYDEDGNFHGVAPEGSEYAGAYGDVYNPVALLKRPTTSNPVTSIDANVYGELNLFDGFKYRSSFSLGQLDSEYKKFTPKVPESGRPSEMNYLNQSWSKRNKWIWDNQVNYAKKFGNHNVDFTGVYSAQFTEYEYNSVSAQDFAKEDDWYQYLGNAGDVNDYYSSAYEDALTSIIGRLSYNFNEKYYLSGSVRRDQTSRLAIDNQSDVFPAFSAAWKLSNESFMQSIEMIQSLKLRASWGQMGNIQSVGYYAYNVPMSSQRPTMGAGDAQRVPGYYVKQISNPDLTWETSESVNFGLDMTLLNGKVDIVADYFTKTTKDLILTNVADTHVGVNDGPTANVGQVKNSGIELFAGYKGNAGNFNYAVNANITSIKNELENLDGYTGDYVYHSNNVRGTLYPYRSEPGQELYSYYLISCEGTFKSQAEIDAHVGPGGELIQPNAKPGDLKFTDINRDGKIDNEDKTYKGSAFPDFTYGFNLSADYKGFDLSMTFQGVSGSKIFNAYKYTTYNASLQGYNLDNRALDAWSTSNTGSDIPLLRVDDPNSNFGTNSDWYLEDGSYLRLKNLTVGYNLPSAVMNRIANGSSMRLYLSAENLFTITNYSGMDPEVGGIGLDVGMYPVSRIITGGLSLKF